MKLKLIDVVDNGMEEVTYGTCDWCMSTGFEPDGHYEFELENGERAIVNFQSWCWGDCETLPVIENAIDFAWYVSRRDFPNVTSDADVDFYFVLELIEDYWKFKEAMDNMMANVLGRDED